MPCYIELDFLGALRCFIYVQIIYIGKGYTIECSEKLIIVFLPILVGYRVCGFVGLWVIGFFILFHKYLMCLLAKAQ